MRKLVIAALIASFMTFGFGFSNAETVWKLGDRIVPGPLPPSHLKPQPPLDQKMNMVFGNQEGFELKLDIAKPKLCKDQAVPCAVFVHGGAWKAGGKDGAFQKPESRMLFQLGFAVASIEYRLAPKYTFPAQINDCKLAIRYLRKNAKDLGIDPDRIGIWGSSAGGHLVSLMGCANDGDGLEGPGLEGVSSSVKCVVDYFGPTLLTLAREEQKDEWGVQTIKDFLGCYPWDCPDKARQASPALFADENDPPMLIQHGDKDTTVPYAQGVELAKAYAKAGGNCALIKVDDAGHGFRQVDKSKPTAPLFADICKKTVQHLVRYLEPALYCDLNMDGKVDLDDCFDLAYQFGFVGTDIEGKETDDLWNPLADLNADGRIDEADWDIFWKKLE